MKKTLLSITCTLLFLLPADAKAQSSVWSSDPELRTLKAFPGAEGFGRNVSGGRGGRVVAVTNLQDDAANPPSGSLRWAMQQHSGQPITVVFRVSGIISLKADLRVKRDNYTIAGHTAPGDGIMITDNKVNLGGSNNVILRHLRFRIGTMNNDPDGKGSIGIENASRFIIDHCTFGWSGEENMTIYDNDSTTIQWSIIHEGLYNSGHNKGNRGYGTQWGGKNATYHHNLLAHNYNRSPRFNGARSNDLDVLIDYVNNVNYNWGSQNSCYGGDIQHNTHRVNFVNNYYKPGPARTGANASNFIRSSFHANQNTTGAIAKWYMSGNYMEGTANANRNTDNYNGLNIGDYPSGTNISSFKASARFAVPYPVTTETAQQAFNSVLTGAGAFPRDAVDTRIVREAQNGTASGSGSFGTGLGMIDNPSAVGGNPTYRSTTAPVDTDGDGIPDAWETANGLNPNNAADGATTTLAGGTYTNLEVYLYDLHRRLMPGFTTAIEANLSPAAAAVRSTQIAVKGKRLSVFAAENAGLQVRVFDVKGRTVARFNTVGSGSLSLSKLPSGRYLAETKERGGAVSRFAFVLD